MWQLHPAKNTEWGRDSSYKWSNNIYSETQQEEGRSSFRGIKACPRHRVQLGPAEASSDLRLLIDGHGTLGELHQRPVQYEDDLTDAGDAVDQRAPHLDVKN